MSKKITSLLRATKRIAGTALARGGRVNWNRQRDRMVATVTRRSTDAREYSTANVTAVTHAIHGRGPDSEGSQTESGVHAVANIPSAHLPSFVRLSKNGDATPYQNGYDLGRYRVGDPPSGQTLSRRERVDRALPLVNGACPNNVYFCALDLNGAGVRFYGDFSLVIRNARMDSNTVVLDRNCYDVERSPIVDRILARPVQQRDRARRDEMRRLSGSWSDDLAAMAVTKVFHELGGGQRRLTTGQISDALLSDEDYVEVLRIGSFGASDLVEARISASDSALESLISSRLQRGPVPRWTEFLWRQRRRAAECALRNAGVATQVVVTTGRVKT